MRERPNRFDRHQNKRALEKKERAKAKSTERQEQVAATQEAWHAFEIESIEGAESAIISHIRGSTLVAIDNQNTWELSLATEIPKDLVHGLVIGDKVLFTELSGTTTGRIIGRHPRTSVLSRFRGDRQRISAASQEEQIIAANVDTAIIVAAKTQPEFHPRFVDRYLVICENGGIEPVVCINKADLEGETHKSIDLYRSAGIVVIETSTTSQIGIEELKSAIKGKLAVLVGNSGVGKSSLINAIVGTDIVTKAVSGKTGKGQHTTTSSNLYNWGEDSYLVDTPGIRSLGVFHVDKSNLQFGFPEFEQHLDACQYHDCSHSHEPICGVKAAVSKGEIDKYRYESYLRMLNE